VRAIDEAEESRLTYMAAQGVVENEPGLKDGNVLVATSAGAARKFLLVQKGQVTFSDSYRLGSLRMREMLESQRAPSRARAHDPRRISSAWWEQITRNVPASDLTALVAMSGESRFRRGASLPRMATARARRLSTKLSWGLWTKSFPVGGRDREQVSPVVPGGGNRRSGPARVRSPGARVQNRLHHHPKSSLRDGLLKEMRSRILDRLVREAVIHARSRSAKSIGSTRSTAGTWQTSA